MADLWIPKFAQVQNEDNVKREEELKAQMAFCCLLHATKISSISSPFYTSSSRCLLPAARASSSSIDEGEVHDKGSLSEIHLKLQGNSANTIQPHQAVENKSTSDSGNVMKLFNDVQQNMLFLNKQRVEAIDDLQKVEREKEILTARISLLEAEVEAVALERDVLQRELLTLKSDVGAGWGMEGKTSVKRSLAPSSVFSELLLRIDSMVLTGAVNKGQASGLKGLALKQDAQAANVFSSLWRDGDKEIASGLLPLLDPNRRFGLHIIHICTELDPVAVSAGLGTFVINLSHALQKKGNLVEVILPKYATMNLEAVQNLQDLQVEFNSLFGGQWHQNKIWTGVVHGIAVTFIDPLHPGGFFLRDQFYNYSDDFERFSYFSRASLDYILKSGKQPDILHLHNWQTALVAPMFWELFASQGLGNTRILFTCDNFRDQCLQEPEELGLSGLDPNRLHRADRLQDNLQPNLVNILKGGIVYSNKVTTVAPVDALDVMSLEHGNGLQYTLMAHKNKIIGIYNGLDVALWNPATDANLPTVYSLENISGKAACKKFLKQRLSFANSDDAAPLVGCLALEVSELEFELIKAGLECALMKGSQFVFMGESKIANVQKMIKELQNEVEAKGGIVLTKYIDSVAHQILAASDILLCTSVNEAAAEMPLIAMQYGSVPVVKQPDLYEGSMKDADDAFLQMEANAYMYRSATTEELMLALTRAIDCKASDAQRWNQLMINGMSMDFSWEGFCVEEYMNAYLSIKQL